MDKGEIIDILNKIGVMLEIKGENFFKAKAYYDAARVLELMEEDVEILVKENRLKGVKGFGEALTGKISELVTTGRMEYYEKLKESIPAGLLEMLKIPGLGPKKVRHIYESLGIATIGELKYACLENRLANLPGFGEKTQQKILEGIENLGKYNEQHYYFQAAAVASSLMETLAGSGQVIRCSEGGSLRRKKETVRDIDLLASTQSPAEVMDIFVSHPLVAKVTSKGDIRSSVVLAGGMAVDLWVVSDDKYPYALHHITGSKEHNTAMRHMAKQRGIKMNEYGLFRGEELINCASEEDIFGVFGMTYIPPELRENAGEIEAAIEGKIPRLIEEQDIKGVFHVHSSYSDGLNSIEDLVKACMDRGYSYLGISDHSQSAYYAGGLKPEDIFRQHEEIDKLRQKYPDFIILKGIELDILPDGSIDYDESVLSLFDFTIASVHSSFKMDEEKMTQRIVSALRNKHVTILGHPTGRLLLSREPYRVDIDEIINTAAKESVVLEINANPFRLDLDWRLCKAAKEKGCMFVICPDAHRISGLDDIRYGLNVARKGWLAKEDVINTAEGKTLLERLKERKIAYL